MNAVYGGAVRATALDSSARALSSLEKNIQLNDLDRDRFELIAGLHFPLASSNSRIVLILLITVVVITMVVEFAQYY